MGDVKITLNPFVFGSESKLECFDEASPCTLEQESMNVIENNAQSVYVPWLVCMDSDKDNIGACDSQVGISRPASTVSATTLNKYLKADESIQQTPTVHINGKNVKTSYSAIRNALCSADPSLSGCSAEVPNDADDEIQHFCVRPAHVVV